MILMHSKKTTTVIIIIIITNRRNEFISRNATRKKSSQSQMLTQDFERRRDVERHNDVFNRINDVFFLPVFVFCFFGVFFVPACQSNGVETDGLILELSLEAEQQQGSNIQGKKTHMGKNENKKSRENET